MVLINDKKYACEKCIKGHRVTGCTHTDRPLYEVKKKGRPTTQCQHCKEKRKSSGSSCVCGDAKIQPPAMIHPTSSTSTENAPTSSHLPTSSNDETLDDETATPAVVEVETRKGQPGSRATFPRGLKDVHELAAAANALAGMGDDDGVVKVAERKVQALLNPCKCQSGGPCKCCHPKKSDRSDPFENHSSSVFSNHLRISTEAPSSSGCCSSSSSTSYSRPSSSQSHLHPHLSPDNMHHPAHTSPHVHKTKLFSPYSTNPNAQSRHGRRDTIGSSRSLDRSSPTARSLRPPPPRIRPLTDMARLIGAAINQDGTLASEIPRSAVGLPKLPGIATFDEAAENGGVKVEPMAMEDVDMPLAFPTSEDVVIGACMCGEDCACPGCATHDNGTPSPGHTHEGGCGEGCRGHHDCSHSMTVPSGVTSIAQLISLAASNVPPPPSDNSRPTDLDPHDTRILPPAVGWSEDVARTMGLVQLKPLECCNGRCQCAPGQCTCEKECCGCCIRCACAEDDEDAKMGGDKQSQELPTPQPSSCCSGKTVTTTTVPAPSLSRQPSPLPSPTHLSPIGVNPPSTMPTMPPQPSPTLLSPEHARTPSLSSSSSRQPSPLPPSPNHAGFDATFSFPPSSQQSSHVATATSLRRATSTSAKHAALAGAAASEGSSHVVGPSGRRATVTGHPPTLAASSKSASKAAAPYHTTQHRAILPKPPSQSGSLLTVNTAVPSSGSRQSSPGAIRHSRSSSSAGPTRSGSPTGAERRASAGSASRGRSSSNVHQSAQQQPVLLQPQPQLSQPMGQLADFSWPVSEQFSASTSSLQPPLVIQTPSSPSQLPSQPQGSLESPYHNLPTLQVPGDYIIPQSVSPDTAFDARLSGQSAEIAAFLNQWSNLNSSPVVPQPQIPRTSQHESTFDASAGPWTFTQQSQAHMISGSQIPAPQADMSGDTSPEIDQPFDIEQFLSQALADPSRPSQAQLPQYAQQLYQQAQQRSSNSSSGEHRSGNGTVFDPSFSDYFLSAGSSSQHAVSLPLSFHNPDGNSLAPPGMRPDLSRNTSGSGFDLPHTPSTDESPVHPGIIPGFGPSGVFQSGWSSKEHLTDSNVAIHSQTQDQSQNQPHNQVPAAIALQGLDLDINALNSSGGQGGKMNENIVDLSKPLDSAALQKIMRALQQQQQQNEQQQTPNDRESSSQMNNQQDQAISQPRSQPPQALSQDISTLASTENIFRLNENTSNVNTTRDLDDMFNQFVTLDGVGAGVGANSNPNPNGGNPVNPAPSARDTASDSRPSGFDMRMGMGMNSGMSVLGDVSGLGIGMNMGGWYNSQATAHSQGQGQPQSQAQPNTNPAGASLAKDMSSWSGGNGQVQGIMNWATGLNESVDQGSSNQNQNQNQDQRAWGL
ncbi:hypothetical protein I317_02112 [Kwoniella heveanensis CBS 569]|nr:hypothetical protein I317_02112 [Kwoniella heveanensis CBS 569]